MERTAHRFQGVADTEANGTELSAGVRYDELARALGCHGEYVDTLGDLVPAVERSLAAAVPAVIHVCIDPEIDANPHRLRAGAPRPRTSDMSTRPDMSTRLNGEMTGELPRAVFVTGANGFMGRALMQRYRSAGVDVRGVDVVSDPDRGVVAGDITDPAGWYDTIGDAQVVIHTAAILSNNIPQRSAPGT